jgi:IS30 family transposase
LRPAPIGGETVPGRFPDPPHTWQRGNTENTNDLHRQFMPNGTDLGDANQAWLNDVAALMNNRPRKTLG